MSGADEVVTDMDLVTDGAVVQMKTGKGRDAITQAKETAAQIRAGKTDLPVDTPVIVYVPDAQWGMVSTMRREGIEVYTSEDQLVERLKSLRAVTAPATPTSAAQQLQDSYQRTVAAVEAAKTAEAQASKELTAIANQLYGADGKVRPNLTAAQRSQFRVEVAEASDKAKHAWTAARLEQLRLDNLKDSAIAGGSLSELQAQALATGRSGVPRALDAPWKPPTSPTLMHAADVGAVADRKGLDLYANGILDRATGAELAAAKAANEAALTRLYQRYTTNMTPQQLARYDDELIVRLDYDQALTNTMATQSMGVDGGVLATPFPTTAGIYEN